MNRRIKINIYVDQEYEDVLIYQINYCNLNKQNKIGRKLSNHSKSLALTKGNEVKLICDLPAKYVDLKSYKQKEQTLQEALKELFPIGTLFLVQNISLGSKLKTKFLSDICEEFVEFSNDSKYTHKDFLNYLRLGYITPAYIRSSSKAGEDLSDARVWSDQRKVGKGSLYLS